MVLDVIELMRRFLQHVLPTGFMKVRYFGFMKPRRKVDIETIRGLIELSYGFFLTQPEIEIEPWEPPTCLHCGALLKLRCILLPSGTLIRPGQDRPSR